MGEVGLDSFASLDAVRALSALSPDGSSDGDGWLLRQLRAGAASTAVSSVSMFATIIALLVFFYNERMKAGGRAFVGAM